MQGHAPNMLSVWRGVQLHVGSRLSTLPTLPPLLPLLRLPWAPRATLAKALLLFLRPPTLLLVLLQPLLVDLLLQHRMSTGPPSAS